MNVYGYKVQQYFWLYESESETLHSVCSMGGDMSWLYSGNALALEDRRKGIDNTHDINT